MPDPPALTQVRNPASFFCFASLRLGVSVPGTYLARSWHQTSLFVAGTAPLSLIALHREHEAAMRAMRASGIRYASYSDVRTGTIRVIVEDPAVLDRLRSAGTVPLSGRVVIVQAAGPFPPLPPAVGRR